MARARIVQDADGLFYGIRFVCPGCALDSERCGSGSHVLPVDWTPPGMARSPLIATKSPWGFNGDLERPAFSPSILSTRPGWIEGGVEIAPFRCHSFVGCHGAEPGQIMFLGDSMHALAGKVMDLPELD